jgi:hypothetical protein
MEETEPIHAPKSDSPEQERKPNVAWYPRPPPASTDEIPINNLPVSETSIEIPPFDPFAETNVKYLHANRWNSIPKTKIEACRRHKPKGVEVRKLPKNHFLYGEYGLFATERFNRFDIIGEYTGKIVGDEVQGGHYVAALEDKGNDDSLGCDAEFHGNEMRFINSYLNVAFRPNVSMRTAYVNTYPHIIIVCIEDIEVGDEILLDYGEAYNKAYLLPKTNLVRECEITMEEMQNALPFLKDSSSDSEGEDEDDQEKTK